MTTQEIADFLKSTGKDRFWLAEKIGVSKHTVDGWFTGRPIPRPKQAAIRRVLTGPPAIDVKLSLSEWQRIQALAAAKGQTTDDFIVSVLKSILSLAALGTAFLLSR